MSAVSHAFLKVVIQKLLGHKNLKSTERYMNIAAKHVKAATEGLALTGTAK